jgi:transcriptional accessory protein Tex/SPT6
MRRKRFPRCHKFKSDIERFAEQFERVRRRAEEQRQRVKRLYEELKALDPELYRECVATATAISLNNVHFGIKMDDNDRRTKLGADIEGALVELAVRLLNRPR